MITERCNNDLHLMCNKPVSCDCKCHDRIKRFRVGGDY